MSESDRGSPIPVIVVVLLLVGGGWYFFRHYRIEGLDEVSINPKGDLATEQTYVSYHDVPAILPADRSSLTDSVDPFDRATMRAVRSTGAGTAAQGNKVPAAPRAVRNLKVASWALDGFGPTKLSNDLARSNVVRVIRDFDIVALQQIASVERDLIPRLVDTVNQGSGRYEYVIGEPTGPDERPEQLAFIFDKTRVLVDRRHTYTLEDPLEQMTFDPLVAWFRAAEPTTSAAWTFSLVNVRIDLARAPSEVALLPNMLSAIRNDGRGEDDVVLTGLFQADDAYLLPTIGVERAKATVRSLPTDIFGKYQTSNLLLDAAATSEYIGRGGVYDYLRLYRLNLTEAEAVTSHLPVYAEFKATEGGLVP